MPPSVEELCEQVNGLPALEKLRLVDAILLQLDVPDRKLETIWAEEVQKRRDAYLAGKITARPYEDVIKRFRVQ